VGSQVPTEHSPQRGQRDAKQIEYEKEWHKYKEESKQSQTGTARKAGSGSRMRLGSVERPGDEESCNQCGQSGTAEASDGADQGTSSVSLSPHEASRHAERGQRRDEQIA
jgi:hypothetical protein